MTTTLQRIGARRAAWAALVVLGAFVAACSLSKPWGGGPNDAPKPTPPAELHAAEAGSIVRVRLARAAASAEVLQPDGVVCAPAGADAEALTLSPPLLVTRGDGVWRFETETGEATLGHPGPITMRAAGDDPVMLDGALHAGVLWLHPRPDVSDGVFDVVEHVGIERYLPGVLSRELVRGWSIETYKAQAIAARSYALHEVERRVGTGSTFDLESTTRSQVYGGLSQRDAARRGAAETAGMILTWRGEVLRAYYSSTSGGRQARARDIWPTEGPWAFNLASPINTPVATPESRLSPVHRWEIERDRAALGRRIAAYAAEHGMAANPLTSLRAIEVGRRNPLGRPATFIVRDADAGSFTMNAEHLRQACNFGSPAVAKSNRVRSGDFEAHVLGDRVLIRGRGFGHGVGMCQWGAEALARDGRTAAEILAHYYPGAVIERRSSAAN